jgi:hydroxymethylpyrimidine/phosphomethylpyrimidine kinase
MDNNGNQIVDYLYEAGSMEMFIRARINESSHIRGTGCIFASIFTAQLTLTESTYEAMINTEQQIENAFRDLFYLPSQNSEISSSGITLDMGITQEERIVLEEVAEVYNFLRSQPSFIHLIPEVRTNISICVPNATKPQHVAAIEGRITVVNNLPHASGPIKFGVSNHTTRLLLASHLKDPQIRAVINVKYLPNLIRPLSENGLILYEVRRDKQSEAVRTQEQSTMQWIMDSTFEQLKMIPDIIWDCGEPEKEPMIRLFARDGKNLIEKLQIILRTFKETYHSNNKT